MKKNILTLLSVLSLYLPCEAQWLWNRNKLEEIKKNTGSFTYANAYRKLIGEAEEAMEKGPYSVTFKEKMPPGSDKHDYVSLSRYFWPDPEKKDGLPYVYRDGESNPELNKYDRNPLGEMARAVTTLSLAYYYSGNERYSKKAVELLRVWFIDKKTKMNPNLNYAQFIPGAYENKGRPSGLIDTYSFVDMLNAVKLLEESEHYTAQNQSALKKWFSDFSIWWQNSMQGQSEKIQSNNHGTTYDVQLAMFSLFIEDKDTALRIINEFVAKRVHPQIKPDGSQPQELKRTLAFHYSVYNLQFMTDMCLLSKSQGLDLFAAESPDGSSIRKAADFLVPYLGKNVDAWPYEQISGWNNDLQLLCEQLYRLSGTYPPQQNYLKLIETYGNWSLSDRNRLLYGASDPIKETFNFAGRQFGYALACRDSVLSTSVNKERTIPRSLNKDGSLRLVEPGDWCSGFFPGSLWFMYDYTKDDGWKQQAEKYTQAVEGAKNDRFSHDTGFKVFCSFGNAYKETGKQAYAEVIAEAAKSLATRYNPRMKLIRSWDFSRDKWQYPVIIDNMMNLELLFEASGYTGNKTFYDIADTHAMKTLKNHFRPDYSSYHVVDYDTISGNARLKQTHQGYADATAWARGQAWGLYGFTMTYRYTRNRKYLEQAQRIAGFLFSSPTLPEDFIPYWDFNDPAIPDAPRDVSAACVIASALYELAGYSRPDEKMKYTAWADMMLANMITNYRAGEGTHKGFLLLHSVGNKPSRDEIDTPISYADYYFLEALLRRNGIDGENHRGKDNTGTNKTLGNGMEWNPYGIRNQAK